MAILAALVVFVSLVVTFVATLIKVRRKIHASDKKKAARDTDAVEEDRRRIGFDLHDGVGAALSSVKLQLECVDAADRESELTIQKLLGHLNDVINNLREISYNITPMALQRKGLEVALKDLLSTIILPGGMKIEYDYLLSEPAPDKAVHIYRLTQEIVNNAVKHSRATLLKIHFSMGKNKIVLRVKDNGVGFNKHAINAFQTGLGLSSIKFRALLLNAKMSLETRPGQGADYQISIPI